jgi:hypothetical protein
MTQIVFIDTAVSGYEALVASIDPALEVFLIDGASAIVFAILAPNLNLSAADFMII